MRKKAIAFLLSMILVALVSQLAFAQVLNTPIVLDTNQTWPSDNDITGISILVNNINELDAITVVDGAEIEFNENFSSIEINPAGGFVLLENYVSVGLCLDGEEDSIVGAVINADTFTITNNIIGYSIMAEYADLTFVGNLNVVSTILGKEDEIAVGILASTRTHALFNGETNIDTKGDYNYGVAFFNYGSILFVEGLSVTTDGVNSLGVHGKGSSLYPGTHSEFTYDPSSVDQSENMLTYYFNNIDKFEGQASIGVLGNLNITTKGRASDAIVMLDSAAIAVAGDTTILTEGNSSYGIIATEYAIVNLSGDLSLITKGVGSIGILGHIRSTIMIGQPAFGDDSGDGGIITFGITATPATVAMIKTSGNASPAVRVYPLGAVNFYGDLVIETSGESERGVDGSIISSVGIHATGQMVLDNSYYNKNGVHPYAYAYVNVLGNFDVTTKGSATHALNLDAAFVTFGDVDYNIPIQINVTASGGNSTALYAKESEVYFQRETTLKATGQGGIAIRQIGGFIEFYQPTQINADSIGITLKGGPQANDRGLMRFRKNTVINSNGTGILIEAGSIIRNDATMTINAKDGIIMNSTSNLYSESNVVRGTFIINADDYAIKVLSSTGNQLMTVKDWQINGLIGTHANNSLYLTMTGDSILRGGGDANSSVHLILKDNSKLILNSNVNFARVEMYEGTEIKFDNINGYHVVNVSTIVNHSPESTGLIVMNVDVDEINPKSDLLNVVNASGEFNIKLNKIGSTDGADWVALIQMQNPSSNFKPNLLEGTDNYITLGTSIYKLMASSDGRIWALRKFDSVAINNKRIASTIGVLEFAKVFDASIADDIINKDERIWFSLGFVKQDIQGIEDADNINQSYTSLVLGSNFVSNEKFSIGAYVGFAMQKQVLNLLDSTNTTTLAAGVSFKYKLNDLIIGANVGIRNYKSDIYVLESFETKNLGLSVSLFAINNFHLTPNFYIAPFINAMVTKVFEEEQIVFASNMLIKQKGIIAAEIGTKVGSNFNLGKMSVDAHIEASYTYDQNAGYDVRIDGIDENPIILSPSHFKIGFGLSVSLGKATKISVDYKYVYSKNLEAPLDLKISISVDF